MTSLLERFDNLRVVHCPICNAGPVIRCLRIVGMKVAKCPDCETEFTASELEIIVKKCESDAIINGKVEQRERKATDPFSALEWINFG